MLEDLRKMQTQLDEAWSLTREVEVDLSRFLEEGASLLTSFPNKVEELQEKVSASASSSLSCTVAFDSLVNALTFIGEENQSKEITQ